MKYKDLTGQRFGRLTVVEKVGTTPNGNYALWLCRCDCGGLKTVESRRLNSGSVKSCGCLMYETQLANRSDNFKHGFSHKERLYETWKNMRRRCYDPTNKRYAQYGGKGVKICEEWDDYLNFRNWAMQNGYSDSLSIDRIDVNGNYCPENCRWATAREQANNMTINHRITYNGQTHTISEWSKIIGINQGTFSSRLQRGWSIERIMTQPPRGSNGT